jgi:conjugative transfer signal peptidase TraF
MPDSIITRMALQRDYVGPGTCPSKSERLLKPVTAIPGDLVVLGPAGITVNGSLLPNSAPLPCDPKGRALPAFPFGEYRVPPGEIWVASDHSPSSFDSRYYGGIRMSDVTAAATPVLTW